MTRLFLLCRGGGRAFALLLGACQPPLSAESAVSGSSQFVARAEVRDVIDRFYDACNHHDWNAASSFFSEDAVWAALPPVSFRLEGRRAIRTAFATNTRTIDVLYQGATAPAISLRDTTHATARYVLFERLRLTDVGVGKEIIGTYVDELQKTAGGWRITRRTFQLRSETDVALPATLIQPR